MSQAANKLELPDDLLRFAQTQVDDGQYESITEVIRDAFSALQDRAKLDSLRGAAKLGFDQLDANHYVEGTPEELMSSIRRGNGFSDA